MIEMHELTDTEVEWCVAGSPTSANTSQRRLMTLSALPSGVNLVMAPVFILSRITVRSRSLWAFKSR